MSSLEGEVIDALKEASALDVGVFFGVSNLLIFLGSVVFCWTLGQAFSSKRIFDHWEPFKWIEVSVAGGSIFFNTGVSMLGWWLWQHELITILPTTAMRALLDSFVMVLAMDFGMYTAHRLAHTPFLYRWVHKFHHRHEATNIISLFVLHPVEVIGFGGLMIAFLMIYPITFAGLLGFLTLNVLFGTLGHSGVEPFPSSFLSIPILRLVGTSSFHAEHHEHKDYNFGFYTLLWDKIFGSLDPEYEHRFSQDD